MRRASALKALINAQPLGTYRVSYFYRCGYTIAVYAQSGWLVPSHPNVEPPQIQREHRSYIYPATYSPCKYDVRILRYDFLVLKINRRIETSETSFEEEGREGGRAVASPRGGSCCGCIRADQTVPLFRFPENEHGRNFDFIVILFHSNFLTTLSPVRTLLRFNFRSV